MNALARPVAAVAAAGLLALTAAGCASGGGGASGASAGVAHSAVDSAAVPGTAQGAQKSAASSSAVLQRQVISTGTLEMTARDVAAARQRILDKVQAWQGVVADEQSNTDRAGAMTRTDLTVRVPSSRFDEAMTVLPTVTHTVRATRSAQDVTTRVIDTNARVQAKQRSVQQLENLLSRATTLGQVIKLEDDISARQAELESLKQQQAWLRDQTSMSTLDITLTRTRAAAAPAHADTGLLAGLSTGVHALGRATVGTLTVLGVLAPFAAVLAVLALPGWWVWRRVAPRRTASAAATPET